MGDECLQRARRGPHHGAHRVRERSRTGAAHEGPRRSLPSGGTAASPRPVHRQRLLHTGRAVEAGRTLRGVGGHDSATRHLALYVPHRRRRDQRIAPTLWHVYAANQRLHIRVGRRRPQAAAAGKEGHAQGCRHRIAVRVGNPEGDHPRRAGPALPQEDTRHRGDRDRHRDAPPRTGRRHRHARHAPAHRRDDPDLGRATSTRRVSAGSARRRLVLRHRYVEEGRRPASGPAVRPRNHVPGELPPPPGTLHPGDVRERDEFPGVPAGRHHTLECPAKPGRAGCADTKAAHVRRATPAHRQRPQPLVGIATPLRALPHADGIHR